MKKSYKDEDLIRFIYDEMDPQEAEALMGDLVKDEALWLRFEQLQETSDLMTPLSLEPSEETLEAVRTYVYQYDEEGSLPPSAEAWQSFHIKLGRFSVGLNAVMGFSLAVVLTLGVIGSAYKLTRHQMGNPNEGPLVQQQDELVHPDAYDWEMKDIDHELKQVREALETIKDDPLM